MLPHRLFVIVMTVGALALSPVATGASAAPDHTPGARMAERFQESRYGPEQTERFSATYKVGSDGALDLQNISGDVRVTTGGGSEIRIEAIKRVRHRNAGEAARYLRELQIEATQVGGRVEVRTSYPRSSGRSVSSSVDYTITVPQGAAVAVKSISGDLSVNGVRGEVRAETISGDVEVVATPNLALAKTVSGDVRAREIGAETGLTLGTVSGNVVATALKVRTLDATSVSGDLQLSNLRVERLTAKTVNGDIEFDGAFARGGRYEFNAHSGDVRLALSDTPGFELDASTFSGSIRSDFPITLRSMPREARDDRGRRDRGSRAIRGTYGDAGAILSIRSFSGTVVITRR